MAVILTIKQKTRCCCSLSSTLNYVNWMTHVMYFTFWPRILENLLRNNIVYWCVLFYDCVVLNLSSQFKGHSHYVDKKCYDWFYPCFLRKLFCKQSQSVMYWLKLLLILTRSASVELFVRNFYFADLSCFYRCTCPAL